jgi:hypothetical protein
MSSGVMITPWAAQVPEDSTQKPALYGFERPGWSPYLILTCGDPIPDPVSPRVNII